MAHPTVGTPSTKVGDQYAFPNPTAGASYEIDGAVLRLKARTVFQDEADAVSNVPTGWTWARTTALTSAVVSSNILRLTHDGDSTNWTAGTDPRLYKSIVHEGKVEVVAKIVINNDAQYEQGGIFAEDPNATTNDAYVMAFSSGGGGASNPQMKLVHGTNAESVLPSDDSDITEANLQTGVWLRLVVFGRDSLGWYSFSTATTPGAVAPSSWKLIGELKDSFSTNPLVGRMDVGVQLSTQNTSDNLVMDVKYLEDAGSIRTPYLGGALPVPNASGYDSSGPAQLLMNLDMGSADVKLSDATLRTWLAQISNTRESDSAAPTFSAVRGTGGSAPSAGSYAVAGSVSWSGTGERCAVYVKLTSTSSAQPGSIRLDIPLVYSAA